MAAQASQQRSQFEQLKQQLNQASVQQLDNLAKRFNQANLPKDPEAIKTKIIAEINTTESKAELQSKNTQKNMFNSLLKDSIKLFLEELILGILFIYFWRFTSWARDTT